MKIPSSASALAIIFLLLATVLNGCGDSSTDAPAVDGKAVKGAIVSGNVSAHRVNPDGSRGDLLATTSTDENGNFSFSQNFTGPIEIVVSGGTYTDEATGMTVDMTGMEMSAMLPDELISGDKVAVTPVTTCAAAQARLRAVNGEDIKSAIVNANLDVASQLGLAGIGITRVIPADLTNSNDKVVPGSVEAQYGLFLAAFSNLSLCLDFPYTDVPYLMANMASDLSDGMFDNLANDSPLPYSLSLTPAEAVLGVASCGDSFLGGDKNKSGVNKEDNHITPKPKIADPIDPIIPKPPGPAPDSAPAPFTFADQTDVALSTPIQSNTITIIGINITALFALTGPCQVKVNAGAFGAAPATVSNNDTVQLQLTSSAAFSAAVTCAVTIGGVADTGTPWSVTTLAIDTTPDPFTFTDQTGVALTTPIQSNIVTVTGINSPAPFGLTGSCQVKVNAGAFGVAPADVSNGDTVQLQILSPATELTAGACTVDIGGVADIFTVTTGDATPAAFTFTDVTNATPSTQYTSNTVTLTGMSLGSTATLTGDASCVFNVDGGGYTTGTVSIAANGTIITRVTSSGTDLTGLSCTVTVNGIADTYTVTTGDATPAAFSFIDIPAGTLSTVYTSAQATLTGMTIGNTATLSGHASCTFSVDGAAFTTGAVPIAANGTIQARLTSSGAELSPISCQVTVGAVNDTYTVTTGDATPAGFAFTDINPATLSTVYTSAQVTLIGMTIGSTATLTGDASCTFNVDSGGYTTGTVPINSNGTIIAQLTSSASEMTALSCTISVSGVNDTYTVTTADTTPAGFTFTDQTGVALSTPAQSNTITVTGINSPATFGLTGPCQVKVGVGAFGAAPANVSNNDTVQLQLTSSASFNTAVTCAVTIGGVADTGSPWSVTTSLIDTTPAGFTFTDQTGVALSTPIQSNTITVTGINSPAAFGFTGPCTVSINSGAFAAAPTTVSLNDTVQLQLTSSASNSTAVTCAVTIGGVADGGSPWSVTTLAANPCASGPLVYTTTHAPPLLIPNPAAPGAGVGATASSTITVPATYSACTITDVNVTVNIVKDFWAVDLALGYVIHPDTTQLLLIHRIPGLGSGTVSGNYPDIIFDDEAAVIIPQTVAGWPLPNGASYKPIAYSAPTDPQLNTFDGKSPSGMWTFRIHDEWNDGGTPGDEGTLNSWTVTIAIN